MKIGIFDPYLDTLGGGERYVLTIASCLQSSASVMLFWDDKTILEKAKVKFNLPLKNVQLAGNIFSSKVSLLEKLRISAGFDVIFYISDGSVPSLLSRKVIPIMQFPVRGVDAFLTELKLLNTTTILCYSKFIQDFLAKKFSKSITVLYPAVNPITVSQTRENIILNVGRFTKANNTKKQDVLIDFFLSHKSHFKGWKLVLIGSSLTGDKDYLESLKRKIEGKKSVEIIENVSYLSLCQYYARAKLYWHATGFGEDILQSPEKAEQFGISIVEAMSAGCVPVVYNGGGPAEIVQDGENGYVWNDLNGLFHKTKKLMLDSWEWEKLSKNAVERSNDFSQEAFCTKLQTLL